MPNTLLKRSTRLILTITCLSILKVQSSFTFNEDLVCPPKLSGPDCTIPYEDCGDGKRRCFNNSRCSRNNRRDKITGEYGYHCDCSFAEEVSKFAGHECEHSATDVCELDSHYQYGAQGKHFCTNGGLCGQYVFRAQIHAGCYCPKEYAGAHCQYLKALGGFNDVAGETNVEDVAENFYAFTPKPQESKVVPMGVVGMIVCVLAVLVYAAIKGSAMRRNGKTLKVIDNRIADEQDELQFKRKDHPDVEII